MYRTKAVYFDGKTSASQPVDIEADERIDEFRMTFPEGNSFVWFLHDMQFEQYNNYLEIRNNTLPMALLKVNDKEFCDLFLQHLKRKGKLDFYHRLLSLGLTRHILLALFILLCLIGTYIYLVPQIAEKAAALIPTSFDDYLGDTFMQGGYLDFHQVDSEKTAILNEFADQLTFNNTHELHFTVIESDVVNAFALPDGNIIVYTGILDQMENSSELAGLLGHEVSHVNNRHSVKTLCRDLAGSLLVSVFLSDVNGITSIIANNAHNLHSLSYSRRFEQEADEQGTALLMQNQVDPYCMVQLFSRLETEEDHLIPEFISTHPLTQDRIDRINRYIQEAQYHTEEQPVLDELFEKLR